MINIISDWESGNGDWENGNGDWGMRKKWGMRMWFFLPPKMVGNGEWGLGNGEWISKWGMHKGREDKKCMR